MPLLSLTTSDAETAGDEPAAIATPDRIELIDRIARETLGLHGV